MVGESFVIELAAAVGQRATMDKEAQITEASCNGAVSCRSIDEGEARGSIDGKTVEQKPGWEQERAHHHRAAVS